MSVNKITVQIEIDSLHPLFKGHFPGNPILPGVVTIQILKELVARQSGEKIKLEKAGNIKYLSVINPEKNNLIDFEIETKEMENGNISCLANIHHNETVFCSFKGEFSKDR